MTINVRAESLIKKELPVDGQILFCHVIDAYEYYSERRKHHVIDACITGTCVIQESNIMRIVQTSPWYYQGVTEINWMAIETVNYKFANVLYGSNTEIIFKLSISVFFSLPL